MSSAAIAIEQEPIVSPKDRLTWLASRGHLSEEQRAAGEMVNKLRERKSRVAYASASGSGARACLNPLEARAAADRQYDRAIAVMTPLGAGIFQALVIDGLSTENAALICGIHPKAVLPGLKIVLDVLRFQYDLP